MPRSRVHEPGTSTHSSGSATQNRLSNAAYAVEFQESGPNFRHADKGQTIPLLDLVAGREMDALQGYPVALHWTSGNGCHTQN